MHAHNSREFFRIGSVWKEVFAKIRHYKNNNGRTAKNTLREAMIDVYGVDINDGVQDSMWECSSLLEKIFQSSTTQKSITRKYETSKCVANQAIKQKVVLKDPIIQGSYLKICENPVFDPDTDILRCKIGHKVLQLRNPYQCLSDISVNPFMELQC